MARYMILDLAGNVGNVIEWDGSTPYDPGDGLKLMPFEDAPAKWIGQAVAPAVVAEFAIDPILPEEPATEAAAEVESVEPLA